MRDKWQVILSGVGGQGLIACGNLMAKAAILYENKYATLSSSHGVETRGTFSKSDVIVSEKEIYYPEVMKEDLVLSLAQVAYDRYVSSVGQDVYLVYDSSTVRNTKESKSKQIGFPFTEIAREIGNTAVANIVALGVIVRLTGLLKEESIMSAIQDVYGDKPKVWELNIKAFKKGIELSEFK
ncbi:MAG: 2-oxoacid:acceptor oxidoreductase family protein [Clostridiaceae bacterium]|jgi:2-oxoglutarate ferredoxin oxidoreductase subunit gamma|nr:2-oxoacid:acceptor oxidoreductase family protein [Clostridiaceae bacterium]